MLSTVSPTMTAVIPTTPSGLVRRLRARAKRPSERAVAALAGLALLSGTGWSLLVNSTHVEVVAVAIIVVVLSSLLLSLRAMLRLLAAAVLCLALVIAHGLHSSRLSVSDLVIIALAALVALVASIQARRRDRLGLRRISAETVLGLIRDRLLVQAQLPSVPAGWNVEIQQRPAHGAAISGDFVANRLVCEGTSQVLHLAVIDVAGCGIAAGPRALLLSGAVGGLLGSVPAEQFLTATNDYLARQQWSVGLASAIYVQLDLDSGEYSLRVAGHPPALHFRPSQAPPWRTSPAAGTVLGVLPALAGVLDQDVLQPGEALFLYTDGMVEDRVRDIDAGTLRLMDSVETLAGERPGGAGLARLLIDQLPSELDDDRTLVMIQRHPACQPIATGRPGGHSAQRQPVPAPWHSGHERAGHGRPGHQPSRTAVSAGSS
ncbi:MAG TPA: PP2C family protein-serine/threonine phosphatase [Jatrophihabitans sp.]|nr:PP2C family protein-serine/threonine phosphatase [Jatrophihabitans sp.]